MKAFSRPSATLLSAPTMLPVVMGVLFLVELLVIWRIGTGRFVLLNRGNEDWVLLPVVYSLIKIGLAAVIVAVAGIMVFRQNRALLLAQGWQPPMLAAHLLALGGLLWALALLPRGRQEVLADPAALAAHYLLTLGLLAAFVLTAALAVAPLHRLRRAELSALWARSRVAVLSGALLAAAIVSAQEFGDLFDRTVATLFLTSRIEGATLDLSLFFYGLVSDAMPDMFTAENGDPLLIRGDFAIQMAPLCAGYQGLFTSMIALSAIIALDWRRLHPARALMLALATVVAVFVMNSVRIATLIYIGIYVSKEVAVNGFHSHFGTLSLLVVVGLAFLTLQHPFFARASNGHAIAGRATETAARRPFEDYADLAPLLLPLAIMLAVSFAVGSFQGEFNWLYFIPASVGAALMWVMRERIRVEMVGGLSLPALVCGVAVYVLWIAMIPPDPERIAMFEAALGAASLPMVIAWVIIRVLGSSIVVPVLEELAFRAGLMRILTRAAAPHLGHSFALVLAVLLSSIAFGLMHADILAATLAGIAFGALAAWRGRIGDAIVAHAVTNFLIAVHVLALGHWSYW